MKRYPCERCRYQMLESGDHGPCDTCRAGFGDKDGPYNHDDAGTPKVFLGGTCNESDWRDRLISMLKINFFNPVVPDWTPECMQNEINERNVCDYCLYVITPLMTGVYSIAEAVDDSNKRPDKTVFCVLDWDGDMYFTEGQMRSLNRVGQMVLENGGEFFTSLEKVADWLNGGGE